MREKLFLKQMVKGPSFRSTMSFVSPLAVFIHGLRCTALRRCSAESTHPAIMKQRLPLGHRIERAFRHTHRPTNKT